MSSITIEGTVTPSTFLPTGERRSVTRSSFVEKLIAKGFVRVVESAATKVEPAPAVESAPVDEEVDVPGRNESRETWAKFLDFQEVPYPEKATRDDLIEVWYADHGQTVG